MLKLHREVLKTVQALHPGIEAEFIRSKTHSILCVTLEGEARHIAVSKTPHNPEHAVRNVATDVRRLFKLNRNQNASVQSNCQE